MQPLCFGDVAQPAADDDSLADGLPHPTPHGIERNRERSGDENQAPWLCPN